MTKEPIGVIGIQAAVLCVAFLNLFAARYSYAFFAFDHLSYLNIFFVCTWTICVMVLIQTADRWGPRVGGFLFLIPLSSVLSFFVLRTSYPTYHGDGTFGYLEPAHPLLSWQAVLSFDPSFRIREWVRAIAEYFISTPFPFDYHYVLTGAPALSGRNPYNDVYITVVLSLAVATVLFIGIATYRHAKQPTVRAGMLLLFLTAPAMLNAYGHFDSYMPTILVFAVWAAALFWSRRKPRRFVLVPFLASLLCCWAHPLMFAIPVVTAAYFFFRAFPKVKPWHAFFLGILLSFSLTATSRSVFQSYSLNTLPIIILYRLHLAAMAPIQSAGAALLLCILASQTSLRHRGAMPLDRTAFMLCGAALGIFCLANYDWAISDEFLFSTTGTLLVFGSFLLYHTRRLPSVALLRAGLLSTYLFVAAAIVYSGDAIVKRWETDVPREVSLGTVSHSPYIALASKTPGDTEALRRKKTQYFFQGWKNPHYIRPENALHNQCFYIICCFEYGYEEAGMEALLDLMNTKPLYMINLWRQSLYFPEDRNYVALDRIRSASRRIISEYLRENPHDPWANHMLDILLAPVDTDSFEIQ